MPSATRRSAGARSLRRRDRRSATSSSASISWGNEAGRSTTTSSPTRRAPAWARDGRGGDEVGARARGRLRRRLRDGARVAARRRTGRTSSSRPWTPSGSRSCFSTARDVFARRSCTSRSGSPSGSSACAATVCAGCMRGALASCAAVLAYSEHEAAELRDWLARHGRSASVEFVPFGVDERAFSPSSEPAAVDVVSVGADPHRDVELLVGVAANMPKRSFRLVTTRDRAGALRSTPANLEVETDITFEAMRRRLQEARVVALPVLENSYSGATTVLLQALALGKPVVVSRTQRDRDRLRPRRRRELQARHARRRARIRARARRCPPRRVARARSRRAGTRERRGEPHMGSLRRSTGGNPRHSRREGILGRR